MSIMCFVSIGCFIDKWSTSLFGVLYWARYLGMSYFWCYVFVWTFWCASWCFINMIIIFAVIAIFGKAILIVNHIIDIIVSVTFLFGVIAISPLVYQTQSPHSHDHCIPCLS